MGKPAVTVAPLTTIRPQAVNANRHTPRGGAALEASVQADGWIGAITVAADGETFDGSQRVETGTATGFTDAIIVESDGTRPVVVRRTDIPTAADPRAVRLGLAANRVAELNLSWDVEVLGDTDPALLEGLWTGDELAELLQPDPIVPGDGGDEFDATPTDGPTRVQPGDVWAIGPHRLVCGDSTDPATYELLMQGNRAALCLTDPPYANNLNYASTNDTETNLVDTINGFLPIVQSLADVVLLTPGNWNMWLYPRPAWTLCWFTAAGAGSGPWGFSCWQPILAYGKDPYLRNGKGRRPDATDHTESAPDLDHPCPKPLKLWTWIMERGSIKAGDVILDPFLGSGTTLIAAHRTGRVCYGVELEPRYCDVILRRAEAEGIGPIARVQDV